jgi:hypothetical protein
VCGGDESLDLGPQIFDGIYGRRSPSTPIYVVFVLVYLLHVDFGDRRQQSAKICRMGRSGIVFILVD